jgi:hypothetical protein
MGKITKDARRAQLFQDLDGIYEKCQYRDWDCDGAKAVQKETIKNCKSFLKTLPIDILPNGWDISAEPDGCIDFEWYKSPKRQISISIGPDKLITYAYIFYRSRQSGTEPFCNYKQTQLQGKVIPEYIIGLIRKVIGG